MKKFSILNSQFSISKGFTLVELLVVIGVFLSIAVVVGGILFSTLRGSQKAISLDEVRQNGNFALSVMERTIRNAKSLLYAPGCAGTPGPNPNSIKIVGNDSKEILFECQQNTILLNSKPLINNFRLDTDLVSVVSGTCNFSCVQVANQPPIIKIKFTLSQNSGWGQIIERTAQVDFETSVTLRNK